MPKRNIFYCLLSLSLFTGLISCTKPAEVPLPNKTTSLAFDTLQGKWLHSTTVYWPAPPVTSPPYTVLYGDSIKFNPDLTGTDHIPQAPVNFTYNLLPDDSTLIFNYGSVTNPQYDTVTITKLTGYYLYYRSKVKTISTPFTGNFYLYSQFHK